MYPSKIVTEKVYEMNFIKITEILFLYDKIFYFIIYKTDFLWYNVK